MKRSLRRQNETAERFAAEGYDVEYSPTITADDLVMDPGLAQKKNPDLRIEGKIFDVYAPRTSNPFNILDRFRDKVTTGQASRIALNLEDSPVTVEQIRAELAANPMPRMRELFVVKGGRVVRIFP